MGSLFSSFFSLRSSLFSLLASSCRRGLVRPRSHESPTRLMISSLLSLLSSLFPLPSALVLGPSDIDRAWPLLLAQGLSQTLLQYSCRSVVLNLIASRWSSSLSFLLSSFFPLPSAIVLRLSDLDRACLSLLVQVFPLLSSFDPCIRLSITLPMSLIFYFFSHLSLPSAFFTCC